MLCADCLRDRPLANLIALPNGTHVCPRCQYGRDEAAIATRRVESETVEPIW